MAPLLFEDIFNIHKIDPDGKKFDKVSRIEAQSDKFDAFILLDINIDVYRINKDKRYTIGLATTLDLDGVADSGFYNQTSRETLADRYDYVMHGRTYRITDIDYEGQEKGLRDICFIWWTLNDDEGRQECQQKFSAGPEVVLVDEEN
uniref:Uncharacterized protein n=1 Tax=Chenopodium quinoa TaxID=63459 RepID=A0A803KLV7_CHEQI